MPAARRPIAPAPLPPPERAVAAAGLLAQWRGLQALGLDMPRLQQAVGELPTDPQAQLPVGAYLRMWAAAEQQYGVERGLSSLPSALAEAIPVGGFGMLDYLCASASSVGGSCASVALHLRIVTDDLRLEVVPRHATAGSCAGWDLNLLPAPYTPAQACEFTLALLAHRLREWLDGPWQPLRAQLPGAPPRDPARHQQLFGAQISYGAPHASLSLADTDWQRPLRRADAELHRLLAQTLSPQQAALPAGASSDLEQALRARLRDALRGSESRPAQLARLMGLSERTLQRRLAAHGRTLSVIVDDFRHAEALHLMTHSGLGLAQIAQQLGYSEQTSFGRAFRRWTGQTPAAWRAARRRA